MKKIIPKSVKCLNQWHVWNVCTFTVVPLADLESISLEYLYCFGWIFRSNNIRRTHKSKRVSIWNCFHNRFWHSDIFCFLFYISPRHFLCLFKSKSYVHLGLVSSSIYVRIVLSISNYKRWFLQQLGTTWKA